MALSDSMFLFEIVLKGIKSYKAEKELKITAEFSDVFHVSLKTPIISLSAKTGKVNVKYKYKVGKTIAMTKKIPGINKQMGQSIIVISKPSLLLSNMKKYPLKIYIWRGNDLNCKLGCTVLPWNKIYTNYLNNIQKNPDLLPPCSEGKYSVYDEVNSKHILSIDMSIKLAYLGSKITSQFRTIFDDIPTLVHTEINSKPNVVPNAAKKTKSKNRNKINREFVTNAKSTLMDNIKTPVTIKHKCDKNISMTSSQTVSNLVEIIKSDSKIDNRDQESLCGKRNNALKYIFGDPVGPFGNQVYCVGYFSVKNDNSIRNSTKISDGESSQKPSHSMKKYKFKKCDNECKGKERQGSNSSSAYSFNLSEETANITIAKCKEIDCNERTHRKLPPPPDDRILFDLSDMRNDCCNENKIEGKIEEVIGGLTAKMKIGEDPCFCTCECTFGFTKKTTYCNVCGGYELAGDELARKPMHEIPIPCPIFHKIIDKNKLKTWSTSGSESRKRLEDQKIVKVGSSQRAVASDKRQIVTEKKSVESEKDSKKGNKKRRDDKFKFNYGYKAPQIGHSKCALPCSGTLENVPKNMGWLWTAENVPGMKVHKDWKPGAVTNRLLRMLNKAKLRKSTVEATKRTRRTKKKIEDKPTLIVSRNNGKYHIEMQVTSDNPEGNIEQYTPLIYEIESTNNKAKIKQKERIQRRLVRAAAKDVWSDPYHPDTCQKICSKTYKQAIGILPLEDNVCTEEDIETINSSSCEDEEASLSCSSSEINWEIHFTPPLKCYQALHHEEKNQLLV